MRIVDESPSSATSDSFRFPQPVRLRPTEPFYCFAPSQFGEWKIEPVKPYAAKYRFVVSDCQPERKRSSGCGGSTPKGAGARRSRKPDRLKLAF